MKLIGQLRLSRWSGMSDHALNEARRDAWVATRPLIEPAETEYWPLDQGDR